MSALKAEVHLEMPLERFEEGQFMRMKRRCGMKADGR